MKIVYLKPQSTWRAELRSDTLWGLICWGIRYIWGEEQLFNMIAEFRSGNPPFLISSAFPYRVENGKAVCYLPKPLLKPFRLSHEELTPERMKSYKDYKKVKYLPLSVFKQLVFGKLDEKTFFLDQESSWKNYIQIKPKPQTYVHNTVDRLGGETEIYNASVYSTGGADGLYFFLRVIDSTYQKLLQALWPFWEHMGLGGDASIGRGFFKIQEEETEELFPNEEGKRFITLSLYSPASDETTMLAKHKNDTWYKLELRKGRVGGKLFVTSHILKQPILMFQEGSSFPVVKKNFYGQVQLVKNVETLPHKIYQYGYAFPVFSIT